MVGAVTEVEAGIPAGSPDMDYLAPADTPVDPLVAAADLAAEALPNMHHTAVSGATVEVDIEAVTAARGATVPIEEAIVEHTVVAVTAAITAATLRDTITAGIITREDIMEVTPGIITEDGLRMARHLGSSSAG